jgi:hypothetical protein
VPPKKKKKKLFSYSPAQCSGTPQGAPQNKKKSRFDPAQCSGKPQGAPQKKQQISLDLVKPRQVAPPVKKNKKNKPVSLN